MSVDHWRDYEYDADLDAVAARLSAANDAGVMGARPEPERASTANPKPAGDELAADQWAHLRRFYVNGDGQ